VRTLKEEIETLKHVIRNTLWMSVRYAHGRHTYAPGIVRGCVDILKSLYPDEQFLLPDRTIKPPSPERLQEPLAFRSDWLDDLFKDVNKKTAPKREIKHENEQNTQKTQ